MENLKQRQSHFARRKIHPEDMAGLTYVFLLPLLGSKGFTRPKLVSIKIKETKNYLRDFLIIILHLPSTFGVMFLDNRKFFFKKRPQPDWVFFSFLDLSFITELSRPCLCLSENCCPTYEGQQWIGIQCGRGQRLHSLQRNGHGKNI